MDAIWNRVAMLPIKSIVFVLTSLSVVLLMAGCGVIDFQRETFAAQPVSLDGDPIYVDDLRAVLQDADLSTGEMVDALRALGIENESLIDAIIADGL